MSNMAFGGDVDTLNLLFDKLQYIFSGYTPIRESLLEINDLFKQNKITEKEFFEKIHDAINRFSALEFLLVKSMFEIKKTLDKSNGVKNNPKTSYHDASSSINSAASFIIAKNLPRAEQNTILHDGEKSCSNCGKIVKKSSKFCTHCGNEMPVDTKNLKDASIKF